MNDQDRRRPSDNQGTTEALDVEHPASDFEPISLTEGSEGTQTDADSTAKDTEPSVKHPSHRDVKPIWLDEDSEADLSSSDSTAEDPAIVRWRAELETRRRAGIPDFDVVRAGKADDKPRRRGASRSRLAALVAVILLCALLVDMAYVGLALRERLSSASSSLGQGREALTEAKYEVANGSFINALDNSREATGLQRRPGWRALRVLPVISDDTETVSVLASFAALASEAGLDVIDLYDRLGATRSGLAGALFDDGKVRLSQVGLAARSVSPLLKSLMEGAKQVNQELQPHLGTLDDALNDVRRHVSQAVASLQRAKTLLAASPSLFGQDTRREYLLLIQDPGRTRASGGIIEYHAILSAVEGELRLGPVLPISTLATTGPEEEAWANINRSIVFPDVARKVLKRYEAQTGRRLDGVIGADSIALGYMARVTGPVRGEGLDLAISENNVARVLMHDVFEHFEGRTNERHHFVADVVKKIWLSVTKGVGDSSLLLSQLDRAAREQHLKVYVSAPSAASAIDQLELSGDPTLFGPQVQMIAQNSNGTSKVDFFLRRESDTTVTLNSDGSASIEAKLTIENQAPDSPPSPVLGTGAATGTASLSIEMLLPEESDHVVVEGEAATGVKSVDGRPLITSSQTIHSGGTQEVTVNYEVPAPDEQTSSFSFALLPAPLAFPDRALVHVIAPEDFCIDSCTRPSPERLDVTTTLTEPLSIQVRLISAK